MDTLVNIMWVIAAMVTGIVAIALAFAALLAVVSVPIFITIKCRDAIRARRYRKTGSRYRDRILPRWINEDTVALAFVSVVLLLLGFGLGSALMVGSDDKFGWPPVPQWMRDLGDEG